MKIRKGKCFIHEKYKDIFNADVKYLGVTLQSDLKLKDRTSKRFERKFSIKEKIKESSLFREDGNYSLIVDNLLFIMLSESKSKEDFHEALCDLRHIVVEKRIEKIAISKSSLTVIKGLSYRKTLKMIAEVFEDVEIEFTVCKSALIPLILVLLIALSGCMVGCPNADKVPIPLIIDDKDKVDKTDELVQEQIKIPGFSKIVVDNVTPSVQLSNCEGNTVYFAYTITQPLSSEIVGTYEDSKEALGYIDSEKQSYTNYYDEENNKYLLENSFGERTDVLTEYKLEESDSGYNVVRYDSKVLFFTDAISPGKSAAKDWNAYESLDSGEHDVQFRISTFDIDTHVSCSSSTINIKVTVNK